MPVTKEQLASIINGSAKELCMQHAAETSAQERQPMYEQRGGGYQNPSRYSKEAAYDREMEKYDKMLFGDDDINEGLVYNAQTASRSRMPENIKQSMLNEQIDVSKLNGNASVLDDMGLNIPRYPQRPRQEQIGEHYQGGMVDYNTLKSIVFECLDEYFSKKPLNESSTLKTIGLKDGKITLIDSSGNAYGAKLQKLEKKNKE